MGRARAVQVEVQPLSLSGSSRLGQSSSSTRPTTDTAFASTALWHTLRHGRSRHDDEDTLSVAVQWPEERRIRGKGKSRNLIVQVQLAPDDIVSPLSGSSTLEANLTVLSRVMVGIGYYMSQFSCYRASSTYLFTQIYTSIVPSLCRPSFCNPSWMSRLRMILRWALLIST